MRLLLMSFLAAVLAGFQSPRASWPVANTTKTLYAKRDLRGKPAPALVAQKWLTGAAPSTKGKVLLVDFWATWCPPCRETIPELNALAAKFKDDLVVIGISKEKPETVQSFMKGTPMRYHVGIDQAGSMDKAVGVEGIPHVLLVSPDGIVRWQGFPLDDADPLTEKTVAQVIAASKRKKS